MVSFINEEAAVDCIITETEYRWKKNVMKVDKDFLVSRGLVTNVRIPIHHIDTVVYSINPKKPAIMPGLKIIGKGVVLAELDVSGEYIESVQDWLLQVINRYSHI